MIIVNYHFIHVLLSMTGSNYTIQPYKKYGDNFVRQILNN